jgi:uncharacterized protein (DUF1800 family)
LPLSLLLMETNAIEQLGEQMKNKNQYPNRLSFLRRQLGIAAIAVTAFVSASVTAQTTIALSKRGGIDIDGNNRSVLLVRSTNAAGAPQLLAGRLIANQFQFTPQADPGANFRLLGVTDFDGNGKSDLAFQDITQGEFGDVKSWNDFVAGNERLFRQVKPVWDVQAVGDLDGDGRGDLVWRYVVPNSPDTGVSYIWFTNPTGAPTVRKRGGAPLDWKLLGAADLNGDGAADMVYISPTGAIRVLMATAARTCANYAAGSVPSGFVAQSFADFTGNGRGEILLRNPTNGQMSLIALNATGISLPAFTGNPDDREVTCTSTISAIPNTLTTLTTSDPSWQLYATGDFNGDGVFDIVWLRPDGTLTLWQMNRNGAAPTAISNVGVAPGFVGSASTASANFAVFQGTTNTVASVATKNSAAASRFLAQATFGATAAEISNVAAIGPAAWIEGQFSRPQTRHLPSIVAYQNTLAPDLQRGQTGFLWSLWKTYTTADDQLRQRIAYSLSQILVISLNSNLSFTYPRGPGNYLDMLGEKAFGNYRDILESVTYSPMMGIYLSSLRNSKENPTTGAVPDENYAREVMQLFTIGLFQLNQDGTVKLDANGKAIETYTNADITGLAKVFTGLSWGGPDTSDNRYNGRAIGADPNREIIPMQAYNNFHSTSEKKFLGVTIPASTVANTNADIKIALDTLFNHPNVGPFIGEQLIQRLVTSNPTAGYVSRVAAAFNDNGVGVRGDMKAVIRAILLDPEARELAQANNETGKIREPAVRFINWMRSFNSKSRDGRFLLGNLSDPSTQLGQTPMFAPSVFNFYRPGYIPPNSNIGNSGLVAPEMQITNETTVAGYLNYMRGVISAGVGASTAGVRDIQPDYSAELALASDPDALIDRANLLLVAGQLTQTTRTRIRSAITSVNIGTTNPDADRRNRVSIAIYLTMASPEYILQN